MRKAFLKSLSRSLVMYNRIRTTEARAKEIRPMVERLVTRAKKDTVVNRREIAKMFDPAALKKIFTEISPRYLERSGGYTRIVRADKRKDGSQMVIMEFV